MDELIVYLCFVCHWTFPEAVRFAKETPIRKVKAFVAELQYQKAVEDYRIASNSALIIATWANAQKKGNHYRITDFIGQPPHRKDAPDKLKKAIEKANIKLPEEI
jgi:hypothetical protein